MDQLFSKAQEIGISHVLIGDLTLRPGCQKDVFVKRLKEVSPELIPEYKNLYRTELASGAANKRYHEKFVKKANRLLAKYELPQSMPHHMRELYDLRQINTSSLQQATKNYTKWLSDEKKVFNRKRSIDSSSIESKLRFLNTTGDLEKILGNKKLATFLGEIIENRGVFDYKELKIL